MRVSGKETPKDEGASEACAALIAWPLSLSLHSLAPPPHDRPPTPAGEKHISGLDDNSLGLTDHDLWLEYKANKARYGVDYGVKPEYRYFARYVEEARMRYNGICSDACTGVDETCFGAAPDVGYCVAGKAARDKNIADVVERTCTRHVDAEIGSAVRRRRLLKKKAKKEERKMFSCVRSRARMSLGQCGITTHMSLPADGAAPLSCSANHAICHLRSRAVLFFSSHLIFHSAAGTSSSRPPTPR